MKSKKLNGTNFFKMIFCILFLCHLIFFMFHSTIAFANNSQEQVISAIQYLENAQALSPGTGITLWAQSEMTILGCTVLGEKGVPAEKIGENVTLGLMNELHAGSTIDVYAVDQFIPYMALATDKGKSMCHVRTMSDHAQTNLWLMQQFLDVAYDIDALPSVQQLVIKRKL